MIDKKYVAFLETIVSERRQELFKEVLSNRTKHFTVAIEDIYQAHNASAVVRTCDIFGIQDIHVIESKYRFKATNQVAKGAQKWMDFTYYNDYDTNNTLASIKKLKEDGYQIVATSPHNESCLLPDFDVTKKSAFFFGVEKEGLSAAVLDAADVSLKIPMVGFTESLNISVAAAIILNDVTARLRKTDVDWELEKDLQDQKYLEWLEKSIKSIKKIKERYLLEQQD